MGIQALLLLLLTACSTGLEPAGDAECGGGYTRDDAGDCISTSELDGDADVDADGDADADVDADVDADAGSGIGNACETPDDCTLDKCPETSIGCTCLDDIGLCVPTCTTDQDCPEVGGEALFCDPDGICAPEGV